MRAFRIKLLTGFLILFLPALFAQKDTINLLVLKSDDVPDRLVSLTPVRELCGHDSSNVVSLVFEGKLSERNVRLNLKFKYKKGTTRIHTDDDGDLLPDQKADVEIFGSNPAADKTTYSVEDEKDEAVVTITSYSSETGIMEGNLNARYWDSATNTRRLAASIRFNAQLSNY